MDIHNRVDLAREQFDVAIELFLAKRSMASVITLAGAADEIFGHFLLKTDRAGERMVEVRKPIVKWVRQKTGIGDPTKPFTLSEMNNVRNALKHVRDLSGTLTPTVSADLYDEALTMLVRAHANLDMLNLPRSSQVSELEEWFEANL